MIKTALFCANDFEECEGLLVVDLLRRAGIAIDTVSLNDDLKVTSSHNVQIICDKLFAEVDFDELDMIILPGGMPGTTNLKQHEGLKKAILKFNDEHKWLAAICAAPSVYGELGLLANRNMTCFPGFETNCKDAIYTGSPVEVSDNFITAKGLGAGIAFASKIIEVLDSKEKANEILAKIQY